MVIFAFWLAAMLLCLAALALLLPPLLRRQGSGQRRDIERQLAQLKRRRDSGEIDGNAYDTERDVLSRRLVDTIEHAGPAPATGLALTLALLLPAAALALYFAVGKPQALNAASVATATPGNGMPQDLDQAIASLEQRLRQRPDDIDGWLLLARTYRSLERFDDMLRATSSAFALAPQSPDIMAEQAEALTLASSDRRFGPQARQLLESALATDAQHQKALWLLGVSELQAQRIPEAVTYWRRLRALIADDDPVARSVDQQIANALAMAGEHDADATDSGIGTNPATAQADPASTPSSPPAESGASSTGSTASASTPTATTGPVMTVRIELDDALRERLAPGDTLFVFVRSANGGPPLAIKRIAAPAFPVEVVLSRADRMLDGVQMEIGADVSIGARVSKSGQAQPQTGDLEAEASTLTLPANGTTTLRIHRQVD